ncbi:MAG: hypothetical protein ACE5GQ_02875 [Nitrospinales bacterium]
MNAKVGNFKNSLLSRVLAVAVLLAAFGYIGNSIAKNWEKLQDTTFHLDIFHLLCSLFFLSIAYFGACFAWFLILRALGLQASYSLVQYNWFLSNLAKYVPGKIWTVSSRAYLHSLHNHSVKTIVSATLLEAIFSIAIAVFVTLSLMMYFKNLGPYFAPLLALLGLCSLLLSPNIFNRAVALAFSLFKKEPLTVEMSAKSRVLILLVDLASSFSRGVAFFFFIKSLVPFSPNELLYFYFCSIFANLVGLLAFFVPKGLGVREGTLILLLSPVISEPAAIVVSIASRLWLIFMELLLTMINCLFLKPQPGH